MAEIDVLDQNQKKVDTVSVSDATTVGAFRVERGATAIMTVWTGPMSAIVCGGSVRAALVTLCRIERAESGDRHF